MNLGKTVIRLKLMVTDKQIHVGVKKIMKNRIDYHKIIRL